MKYVRLGIPATIALLLFVSTTLAQQSLLMRRATVYTVTHGVLTNASVLVVDGKIARIASEIDPPPDARIMDLNGAAVTPGLIDARAFVGVTDAGIGDPQQLAAPKHRVANGLAPVRNPGWLADGVTAMYLAPGPYNLIGGTGTVVRLTPSGLRSLREDAGLHVAFGDVTLRSFKAPTTRQGLVAVLRQAFIAAAEYQTAPQKSPGQDSMSAALVRVLMGEIPLRVAVQSPDDIMTALRIAKEFDIRIVIDGASGASMAVSSLLASRASVVLGPTIFGVGNGGDYERYATVSDAAARLSTAGVRMALSTEGTYAEARSVAAEALYARGNGLSPDAALRAVTLDAAAILGVDARIGSIDVGKDADLIIWEGAPLSTWGKPRVVFVEGQVVYERPRKAP